MDRDNEIDLIQTIQKKDKVIDEMAEILAFNLNWQKLIGHSLKDRKEIVKSEFYKKVEDDEKLQ